MRVEVHHNKPVVHGNPYLGLIVFWNSLYSLFVFFIAGWVFWSEKFEKLNALQSAWYTAMLAVWAVLEPVRLRLGIRGNRVQSVAHLFGFVLLTLLVHIIVMAAYNVIVPVRNSFEYSMSIVQLLFGVVEFVVGVVTLRHLVRRNTVDFFVHVGMVEEEEESDDESGASDLGDLEDVAEVKR